MKPIHELPIGPSYRAVVYIDGDEFVSEARHAIAPSNSVTRHASEPEAIKAMYQLAEEKKAIVRKLADQLKPMAGKLQHMGAEGLLEFVEKAKKQAEDK